MSEPTVTVRDIEWRTKSDLSGDYVFAEDDYLFTAQQYSQQVCEEHNTYQALRKALASLVGVGPPMDPEHSQYACCGERWFGPHASNCPWLMAKQLLEESEGSGE